MVRREDDYGQVDGDGEPLSPYGYGEPLSPYGSGMRAAPWLRGGMSPWHMWGNIIQMGPLALFTDPQATTGQLVKVAYKRPETWHWLFAARMLSAPVAGVAGTVQLTVDFDAIVGLGRATTEMRSFERFRWTWTGAQPAPIGYVMWSTSALAPATDYTDNAGTITLGPQRRIDQISAQDIQLNCRASFVAIDEPIGGSARIEVAAFFSPKHHARPDWYLPGPSDAQFAGEEVAGR